MKLYLATALAVLTSAPALAQDFGPPSTIASGNGAYRTTCADFDGDGLLDVACVSTFGPMVLVRNSGSGLLPPQTVDAEPDELVRSRAADIDLDGDLDLVVACRDKGRISWYANDGQGDFGTRQDIVTDVYGAYGLAVADIDGDGAEDVLFSAAPWYTQTEPTLVGWCRNLGGGALSGPVYLNGPNGGSQSAESTFDIACGDADGDGDLDLVAVATTPNRILLYSNEGGAFGAQTTVVDFSHPDFGGFEAYSVTSGDLDGDGSSDFVIGGSNSTAYALFGDAQQPLSAQAPVLLAALPNTAGAQSVAVSDLNGDGHQDVALCTIGGGGLWIENSGLGSFLSATHINTGGGYLLSIESAQLIGSPGPELILADYNFDRFSILENLMFLDCNGNGFSDALDIANGTSQDCNANGIPDECDVLQPGLDCDSNGLLDSCELSGATDCDANGLLDVCEIGDGSALDCNLNSLPDACDIAANPQLDCDGNGVIDFCGDPWVDCNGNGVLDSCEVLSGAEEDCDGDGLLDSCLISTNPLLDCDGNGRLDSCEISEDPDLDQDGSGTLDSCECSQFDSYCTPTTNSTLVEARIGSIGLASIAANEFTLLVSQAPSNTPGIFFYGAAQASVPFGDGVRCIATPVYRLAPAAVSNAAGDVIHQVDLTTGPPSAGAGAITAGSTWHFQYWFRDPQGGPWGFNLSDGLKVTFCP